MSIFLLDVNVLLAIAWPAQESHTRVANWFRINQRSGWATCPLTQIAFVRILSNPAFSNHAPSPEEAAVALDTLLQHPTHKFWAADVDYVSAVSTFSGSISGHKQVADAYLLGLAMQRRGRLATLDHRIRTLLPEASRLRDVVVEI